MNGFDRYFPLGHPDALPPETHLVSSERAKEMIRSAPVPDDTFRSVTFHGDAHKMLMKQHGAVGFTVIPCSNGHHNTVLIVAVDVAGLPLLGPGHVALDNGQRCPPLCDPTGGP